MKNSKVALFIALCFIAAGAQDKPKADVKPDAKPAEVVPAPAPLPPDRIRISDKAALRIRDAQIMAFALRDRQAANQKELQEAVIAAYTEAKVEQKDYVVNDESWELVRKVQAPTLPNVTSVTVAPKEEVKKAPVKKETPTPAKKKK